MPLDPSVRSAINSAPEINRTSTPPRLHRHHSDLPPSNLENLSYSQFNFDTDDDKLGKGGNAVVYQATVSTEDVIVALKQPFPNTTVNTETVKQILDEAKKWATVDDHPYIGSIFDWGADGPPWIAIEYLRGGSLDERLADDEFGLFQRIWTAYALVDAVAYATGRHGLTHHDLHPQNIIFQQTQEGVWDVPKVVDWGLSRELIQHTSSVSQATPEYAAPEQFDSLMPDVAVGPHTDVYQLGVVCYELLTGTHPAHLRDNIVPPSEHAPELTPAFDEILLQALAHARQQRYRHPLLFREELSDLFPDPLASSSDTVAKKSRKTALGGVIESFSFGDGYGFLGSNREFCQVQLTESSLSEEDQITTVEHPSEKEMMYTVVPVSEGTSILWNSQSNESPVSTSEIILVNSLDNLDLGLKTNPADVSWHTFGGNPARTGHCSVTGPQDAVNCDWRFQADGMVRSSPAVVENTVYIGSGYDDIHVYALDASDGTQQWQFQTDGMVRSSPAVAKGTVYVGSFDNCVYALDASDGTQQWQFQTDGKVRSSPVVVEGTVYVGSFDDCVYALDTSDGTQQWCFQTNSGVYSSPSVVDETVYVGSWDNSIYAVNAGDGTERWRFQTGDCVWSSPAVTGDMIYIGSDDGNVYALDASDGSRQWQFQTQGKVRSSPSVINDTIYFGSFDTYIYAVDAINAIEHWRVQTGDRVCSSPTVTDDIVYIGSDDGNIYALDASDGGKQWYFSTRNKVDSSPAVIDKTVYIGSYNNNVYALSEKSSLD